MGFKRLYERIMFWEFMRKIDHASNNTLYTGVAHTFYFWSWYSA